MSESKCVRTDISWDWVIFVSNLIYYPMEKKNKKTGWAPDCCFRVISATVTKVSVDGTTDVAREVG